MSKNKRKRRVKSYAFTREERTTPSAPITPAFGHPSSGRRGVAAATPPLKGGELFTAEAVTLNRKGIFSYLRNRLWLVGLIALLSLGVLGSGLKYLEEDARKQAGKSSKDQSLLSKINPFIPNPPPSPTPQLSKEYIYAGSRLLAVEDVNANAAPPADLAIWRPSTGVWWVMGGTGSQQVNAQWGQGGDIPAPGDYDGDGKTDFCIFRPSTGYWWVVRSSDNNYYSVSFGTSGDKPVPGDFDGDGKTDLALFRSSDHTWYIYRSSDSSLYYQSYGLSTDKAAPADYDGDGRADIAVWRGSDKTFYVLRSSDGQNQGAQVGSASTDEPVSADYDGDGKADYAVLNGNVWIIKKSSDGSSSTTTWQNSGDTPVQNDYDADGKVDIAVWRDSNGYWYIKQSTDGQTRSVQWGASGDIPVPAFYRR